MANDQAAGHRALLTAVADGDGSTGPLVGDSGARRLRSRTERRCAPHVERGMLVQQSPRCRTRRRVAPSFAFAPESMVVRRPDTLTRRPMTSFRAQCPGPRTDVACRAVGAKADLLLLGSGLSRTNSSDMASRREVLVAGSRHDGRGKCPRNGGRMEDEDKLGTTRRVPGWPGRLSQDRADAACRMHCPARLPTSR